MATEIPKYFNDLCVDLNDESLFPPDIYERTKVNPNPDMSRPCVNWRGSLDAYADTLAKEMFASLRK
jgi:hypothetical protein